MFACRSRDEPNSSRELFRCTRSIRPVIALTRSTIPTRSSPAANAWHVSRQNPAPNSPTASHSRASMSNRRAIALSPPAVFSIRIGTGNPPSLACRSKNFRQLSMPTAGSSPLRDVTAVHHQALRADRGAPSACCATLLRHGIRIRLFIDAMLIGYGECTKTSTSLARSASALRVLRRLLPALRIGQEELHDLGAPLGRGAERVVVADMGTYAHDQRA